MAYNVRGVAQKVARTSALINAARELGFSDTLSKAMTHIETFTGALEARGLTWADVPEQFNTRAVFPPNAIGHLVLRACRIADPGFRLFEAVVEQPGIQRDVVLGAYERCLQSVPLPVETPEQ